MQLGFWCSCICKCNLGKVKLDSVESVVYPLELHDHEWVCPRDFAGFQVQVQVFVITGWKPVLLSHRLCKWDHKSEINWISTKLSWVQLIAVWWDRVTYCQCSSFASLNQSVCLLTMELSKQSWWRLISVSLTIQTCFESLVQTENLPNRNPCTLWPTGTFDLMHLKYSIEAEKISKRLKKCNVFVIFAWDFEPRSRHFELLGNGLSASKASFNSKCTEMRLFKFNLEHSSVEVPVTTWPPRGLLFY